MPIQISSAYKVTGYSASHIQGKPSSIQNFRNTRLTRPLPGNQMIDGNLIPDNPEGAFRTLESIFPLVKNLSKNTNESEREWQLGEYRAQAKDLLTSLEKKYSPDIDTEPGRKYIELLATTAVIFPNTLDPNQEYKNEILTAEGPSELANPILSEYFFSLRYQSLAESIETAKFFIWETIKKQAIAPSKLLHNKNILTGFKFGIPAVISPFSCLSDFTALQQKIGEREVAISILFPAKAKHPLIILSADSDCRCKLLLNFIMFSTGHSHHFQDALEPSEEDKEVAKLSCLQLGVQNNFIISINPRNRVEVATYQAGNYQLLNGASAIRQYLQRAGFLRQ